MWQVIKYMAVPELKRSGLGGSREWKFAMPGDLP